MDTPRYSELPDDELEHLAREGDELARQERWHRQTLRFEGANDDLPIIFEGVWIRFRNEDGYIRMALEFMPGCTVSIDSVRQNWHIVAEWQRRLLKWQGPWDRGGDGGLYAQLSQLSAHGESYRDIAIRLNAVVMKHIRKYHDDCVAYAQVAASMKTYGDLLDWQYKTGRYAFGRMHAKNLMVSMGLSDADAEAWCAEILRQLAAGEPITLPDTLPITRDHVIARIRARRGVVKTGRFLPYPRT